MRSLLIQPMARHDLLDIRDYISADNVRAADKFINKLDRAIHGLLEMPGKGHRRRDVKDERYRFWTVYSYVIAYRYDETSLTVVRVIHGRRDFRKRFPT